MMNGKEFEAVQLGHHHVAYDQIEGSALRRSKSLATVFHRLPDSTGFVGDPRTVNVPAYTFSQQE